MVTKLDNVGLADTLYDTVIIGAGITILLSTFKGDIYAAPRYHHSVRRHNRITCEFLQIKNESKEYDLM